MGFVGTFASFGMLSDLDSIVDMSQTGPFIRADQAKAFAGDYFVVKVMGKGNVDKLLGQVEAGHPLHARVAVLNSVAAFAVAEQAILKEHAAGAPSKRLLVMYDGDNRQDDSPFTNFIAYLARREHLVLAVPAKVDASAWAPRHIDEASGRPKCTSGTWPLEAASTMYMAWSEGATPAEITLGAAQLVLVYGSAEFLSADATAASQTTTSAELKRFEEFGLDLNPRASWVDGPSTQPSWTLHVKKDRGRRSSKRTLAEARRS